MTTQAHEEAYSEIDRAISRQVKLAIFDSGKTQKAIAFQVGMATSSFSKSMQGLRPWRAEELIRIAQATGVSVTVLLPNLDSNQEPSDYRSVQVSGGWHPSMSACRECGFASSTARDGLCDWCGGLRADNVVDLGAYRTERAS